MLPNPRDKSQAIQFLFYRVPGVVVRCIADISSTSELLQHLQYFNLQTTTKLRSSLACNVLGS
jgi:hypothetical protein